MTTHLGLDNISLAEAMPAVLGECARITSGSFLAICQAEVDEGQLRWPPIGGRDSRDEHPALTFYTAAGLRARVIGSQGALAQPTPSGEVLDPAAFRRQRFSRPG